MLAEGQRISQEKSGISDGSYMPFTNLARAQETIGILLKKSQQAIVWNNELFEAVADTFAAIKKVGGNDDDTSPVEIQGAVISWQEFPNADPEKPIQVAGVQFHDSDSGDDISVTLSRSRDKRVKAVQISPPANGISFSRTTQILELLSQGLNATIPTAAH